MGGKGSGERKGSRATRRRRALRLAVRSLCALSAAAMVLCAAPAARADEELSSNMGMEPVLATNFCGAQGTDLDHHGGDIAFWGRTAVVACGAEDSDLKNDGFVILDISDPTSPVQKGVFRCVASASDIQVWGHLVFMAVDRNAESSPPFQPGPRGDACDAEPESRTPLNEPHLFQGIRIVDISDPSSPRLVRSIRINPPGAHTLTVVGDPAHRMNPATPPRVVVYAARPFVPSPTSSEPAWQPVFTVPLNDPADVTESRFDPGSASRGCHDISVFEPRGLAVCTGIESGSVILDVRDDPGVARDDGAGYTRPMQIAHIPNLPEHTGRRDHGAAFSWDGRTLVIGDENTAALSAAACTELAKVWFYDVSDPERPEPLGHYAHPPYAGNLACHAKQMNVVPLKDGRDVAVVSWVGGGTSLIDFTRVNHSDAMKRAPAETVAHAIAGQPEPSAVWAAYWYNGHVWANNVYGCLNVVVCGGTRTRGLEVFELTRDLGAAAPLGRFNYPTQECLRATGWTAGELAVCSRN